MSHNFWRVFLVSLISALVVLSASYFFGYICFAEDAVVSDPGNVSVSEPGAETDAGVVETLPPGEGGESSSEDDILSSSESESSLDDSASGGSESSLPENNESSSLPDDDFGQEIDPPEIEIPSPDFEIDPGMTLDPEIELKNRLYDDVHYIRIYVQFFLLGFLPIVCAVVVIYLFLRWFYCTFIDSAL